RPAVRDRAHAPTPDGRPPRRQKTTEQGKAMLALALALLGSLHGGAAVPLAEPGQDVAVEAIPPVRDRADAGSGTLQIAGLRVEGVGEHPQAGIAPATMQALAERTLAGLVDDPAN